VEYKGGEKKRGQRRSLEKNLLFSGLKECKLLRKLEENCLFLYGYIIVISDAKIEDIYNP
jgi:hypothetical protein